VNKLLEQEVDMSQTMTVDRVAALIAHEIETTAGYQQHLIYRAAEFDGFHEAVRVAIATRNLAGAALEAVEFVAVHDESGTVLNASTLIPEHHGQLAAVITIKSTRTLDEPTLIQVVKDVARQVVAHDTDLRASLTSMIHIIEEPTPATE
jgi:pyruvate/2-oxoglutarate/acetoin dehydrogenase E1 component